MLREAKLTKKEQEALDKSLRVSRRRPPVPVKDQVQPPPYALLPLLPHIPAEWIIWESNASKQGYLAETIRAMKRNIVIESGPMLDGANYLSIPPKLTAQMQIAHPLPSMRQEWLARSYDNHQAFALLMSFEIWTAAEIQSMFQRYGVSVIILNRPVRFHEHKAGWNAKKKYPVAWFTWGLPGLKEPITYGHIPLEKNLPKWMIRPDHKREITEGAKSMEDKLAIKQATNPLHWPAPIRKE
jgi:hypothetical protein